MQAARDHMFRSPRVEGLPLKNHVRVSFVGNHSVVASYSDVSDTGMRVRSGVPARASIGDVLVLEFRVPGERTDFRGKAKVVRITNQYEFAVQFLEFDEGDQRSLAMAVAKYMEYVRRMTPFMKGLSEPQLWVARNWQLLLVTLTTAIVGGFAVYSLFTGGDWTRSWPKEWDMEYYKNLPESSKRAVPHRDR